MACASLFFGRAVLLEMRLIMLGATYVNASPSVFYTGGGGEGSQHLPSRRREGERNIPPVPWLVLPAT